MTIVDVSMVELNLREAQRYLTLARGWLDVSIQAACEVGAEDFAHELTLIKAHVEALNPTATPLQMLADSLARHKGILDLAELKHHVRRIASEIKALPMPDTTRKLVNKKIDCILEDLDQRKV